MTPIAEITIDYGHDCDYCGEPAIKGSKVLVIRYRGKAYYWERKYFCSRCWANLKRILNKKQEAG